MNGRLLKDFHKLLENIEKLSDGQATVCLWDSDDLSKFVIEISPKSGYYKGGKFKFKFDIVEMFYPIIQPSIKCITPIYHPNIDTVDADDNDLISNVCVSMLDEWKPINGLDDCIQALLFLFQQPNTTDSLRFADSDISENKFKDNVQTSLRGGVVEGCYFNPNYGWIENFELPKNTDQFQITDEPPKNMCKQEHN